MVASDTQKHGLAPEKTSPDRDKKKSTQMYVSPRASKHHYWAGEIAQLVECSPHKHKALDNKERKHRSQEEAKSVPNWQRD
uniref:Uncharacterized protein n=1 Tax=Sciurus vulgaris TaxID=55149 RepID=A0A8D2D136_SCIVU